MSAELKNIMKINFIEFVVLIVGWCERAIFYPLLGVFPVLFILSTRQVAIAAERERVINSSQSRNFTPIFPFLLLVSNSKVASRYDWKKNHYCWFSQLLLRYNDERTMNWERLHQNYYYYYYSLLSSSFHIYERTN